LGTRAFGTVYAGRKFNGKLSEPLAFKEFQLNEEKDV
jgi:hypothetical protein